MKKTWLTLTFTAVLVFALSLLAGEVLLPWLNSRTYSQTACLTDQITENMDIYDIAKLYRDNNSTVAVTVQARNTSDGYTYTSLGSGVCVASNGYETKSLENNIVASKGSYVVTNYHVIDMVYDSQYTNEKINLLTEEEIEYPCELLWSNANLDVAVLYCEENLDYVRMKDRIISPNANERLDYEPIFTIGTPLDLSYINRLTVGNVASNNLMTLPCAEYVYPSNSSTSVIGLYNAYEDVVDITVGITNGNSGGGCFDENGVLIGLTTLGLNVDSTGGNQMNGMVPIYPILQVLDKLISNNEQNSSFTIHTNKSLGLKGFDMHEASSVIAFQQDSSYNYYYFDGQFYSVFSYSDTFSFSESGYYVLSNTSTKFSSIKNGSIITNCKINETNHEILDRNDFIYALLQIDAGDTVEITSSYLGVEYTQTVQF